MRERVGDVVRREIRSGRLSNDVLSWRLDVYSDGKLHLIEWCTQSQKQRSQALTVKLEEFMRLGCEQCGHEYNLDHASYGLPAGGVPSPARQRLSALLQGVHELQRIKEGLKNTRGSTPFEEAGEVVRELRRLRRKEFPAELSAEVGRVTVQAEQLAQEKLARVRAGGGAAALRRQVEGWYQTEEPCVLGLPNWATPYARGRRREALELLVSFSVPQPDPDLLLSRVPGWAVGFILDLLGDRPGLEMAEDTLPEGVAGEIFQALWPGMPLLEAVAVAQTLA